MEKKRRKIHRIVHPGGFAQYDNRWYRPDQTQERYDKRLDGRTVAFWVNVTPDGVTTLEVAHPPKGWGERDIFVDTHMGKSLIHTRLWQEWHVISRKTNGAK